MSRSPLLLAALLTSLLAVGQPVRAEPLPRGDDTAVLVAFDDDVGARQRARVVQEHGARSHGPIGALGIEVVEPPRGTDPRVFAATIQGRHEVRYAEPDGAWFAADVTDPRFGELWGLNNTGQIVPNVGAGTPDVDVNAPQAWATTRGETSTVVAVIDEGVDITHPDLYERIYLNPDELPPPTTDDGDGVLTVHDYTDGDDHNGNGYVDAEDLITEYHDGVDGPDDNVLVDDIAGWDFSTRRLGHDPSPGDNQVWDGGNGAACGDRRVDDHGTHVAGTIAATANDVGVVGVAPAVRILPLKFLPCGAGSTSNALAALVYADQQGVRITNNSWGAAGSADLALRDGIEQTGLLFVAAAGNSAVDVDSDPFYPAAFDLPNVIAVAAVTNTGSLASFSNHGRRTIDVAAPGSRIVSTLGGDRYGYLGGTSMATPHVSGIAALVTSHAPTVTTERVIEVIRCGTRPLDALWGRTQTGGLIRADAALTWLPRPGPPTQLATSTTVADARITWQPPAHLEGGNVTGYRVRLEPGSHVAEVGSDVREVLFTHLAQGGIHRVHVTALTSTGNSCAATRTVLIVGPPSAPRDLVASGSDRRVELTWSPPADDGGAPIEGHRIELAGSDGTTRQRDVSAVTLAHEFTDLVNGVTYRARVAAWNEAGLGPAAAAGPVAPLVTSEDPPATDPQAPPTPGRFTAQPLNGAADVTWDRVDGADDYVVSAMPGGHEVVVTGTSTRLTGLVNGEAHRVEVVARNAAGLSDPALADVTPRPPAASRLAGPDRYATAAAVVAAAHPGAAPTVYLATGSEFPDALAAAAAVGSRGAPVLLTRPDVLPEATAAQLRRLAPLEVVIVGGPAAVSDDVARTVTGLTDATVSRLAGPDRYATAAALGRSSFPQRHAVVYVATGTAFPDALALSSLTGAEPGPLLLVRHDEVPEATRIELQRLAPERIVLAGGTGAVSEVVADTLAHATGAEVVRIEGADRYATAAALSAASSAPHPAAAYLATGRDFPDAIAAGAAAAAAGVPLLLVPSDGSVPTSISAELSRLRPTSLTVVGGPRAVGELVVVLALGAAS